MKDHVLVFIPGILGTELRYKGPGRLGALEEIPVWTEDVGVLFDTLASRPEYLHFRTTLITGKILKRLHFKFVKEIEVYGPLLEFFATLAYKENEDFLPFAYDWRKTNAESAALLASELRTRFPSDLPLKFVAHSMGGIIVRLMLSQSSNADLLKRTRGFIQIGVPARGSSKAFKTLKHSPTFNALFDSLLSYKQHLNPELHARLLSALNSFPSLFELMPPDSERIAVTKIDLSYPALNKGFWPDLPDAMLAHARTIHDQLGSCDIPCALAIYSADITTDRDYLVDDQFVFQRVERTVIGDGTVSVASAIMGTSLERRHVVTGGIPHDKLPNHRPQVWSILKRELADGQ